MQHAAVQMLNNAFGSLLANSSSSAPQMSAQPTQQQQQQQSQPAAPVVSPTPAAQPAAAAAPSAPAQATPSRRSQAPPSRRDGADTDNVMRDDDDEQYNGDDGAQKNDDMDDDGTPAPPGSIDDPLFAMARSNMPAAQKRQLLGLLQQKDAAVADAKEKADRAARRAANELAKHAKDQGVKLGNPNPAFAPRNRGAASARGDQDDMVRRVANYVASVTGARGNAAMPAPPAGRIARVAASLAAGDGDEDDEDDTTTVRATQRQRTGRETSRDTNTTKTRTRPQTDLQKANAALDTLTIMASSTHSEAHAFKEAMKKDLTIETTVLASQLMARAYEICEGTDPFQALQAIPAGCTWTRDDRENSFVSPLPGYVFGKGGIPEAELDAMAFM